jgi:DNA polymerase III epsilon subunit-like protein
MLIFVDTETTGLNRLTDNILSLGAVTEDGKNEFYMECRLNEYEGFSDEALAVNGFSKHEIYSDSKADRRGLYNNFSLWVKHMEKLYGEKPILAGENIGSFDMIMLSKASNNMDEITFDSKRDWNFGHRFLDVHSVALVVTGVSQSLDKSLQFFGLPPEKRLHNALSGAKAARDLYMECMKYVSKVSS